MGRRRPVTVWAGLSVVLLAVLSVASGLLVNAAPKSWQWAHNWVLLLGITAGVVLAAALVAITQARSQAGGGLSLVQVADQLAVAIEAQWRAEATVRRLNDPYPLSVSWHAADASLTDAWASLEKLATSGAGWPAHPPAGTWAAGPDDLAGEGGELAEVLARVPTGRLVVLGEPGAGKTMLTVRLMP